MFDLISIGNISVDMYFKGESITHDMSRFQLAIGGKYSAQHFFVGLGGGGANVAVGAVRHGLTSAIMGKIGKNSFKSQILRFMAEHNISNRLCSFEDDYMKISTILLTEKGERTIVNYETPHEHIIQSKEDLSVLKSARIVYVSNLPRVTVSERVQVLHFLKGHNIPVVMNMGIVDCRKSENQIKQLVKHITVLIVNSHEFCEMVKVPYDKAVFTKPLTKYMRNFNLHTLVITDAEKGSYAYNNDKVYIVPANKTSKIIDTTGAGDAYTAGFLAGYYKGYDILKSMEMGTNYSTKIIEKIGAN